MDLKFSLSQAQVPITGSGDMNEGELPDGIVGESYSYELAKSDYYGRPKTEHEYIASEYTYQGYDCVMPEGLNLTDGIISGIPQNEGTWAIYIKNKVQRLNWLDELVEDSYFGEATMYLINILPEESNNSTSSDDSNSSSSSQSTSSSSNGQPSPNEPDKITKSDSKTNIELSAPYGTVPEETTISVEIITSGANYTLADNAIKDVADKFTLFDISLMNDNAKIQPNGKVQITIPVPSGYNGANCKIYRIEENGDKTDMDAELNDGKLIFETDHFSLYAVAQMKASDNPETGENSGNSMWIIFMIISAGAVIFIKARKMAK